MSKCTVGWDSEHNKSGACCCNCVYQKKLMCHPWNSSLEFSGRISRQVSIDKNKIFVCVCPDMEDDVIAFDKQHGMCEMHMFKNKEKQNV